MTQTSPDLNALDRAEVHRAFVREIDKEMGTTYGYGGGVALLFAAAVLGVAWVTGYLFSIAAVVFALTAGLVGLFVARAMVARKRPVLRARIEHYCDANDLKSETLREFYARDTMYPYFLAVLETREKEPVSETTG